MRIWLALARASILWLRDRSGAVEVFEDVVPVTVAMGGESTLQRPAIKRKSRIHLYLNLRGRWIEVGGWSRGAFAGVFSLDQIAVPERFSLRQRGRGSSRFRPRQASPPRP